MRDPVFTSDGETYEREEIERWLAKNQTSPSTNMKLTDKVLKPNIALKKAINTFLEQHPEFLDEVYFSKSLELQFIEACKTMGVDTPKEAEGTKEVKRLIQLEKRFLNHRFENGGTILHIAAQFSSFETLKAVIKVWKSYHKTRPHPLKLREVLIEPDYLGWTPLHYAAQMNIDHQVVKEVIHRLGDTVLEKAFPLSEKQRKGKEAEGILDAHFLQAVKDENIPLMEIFLKLGANIEARDLNSKYRGGTALHIAASKGSPKVAEFLLEKGAAIHSRTGTHPCDFASVHFAARGGHKDVLAILLDRGADINMKCNPNGCKDWTPLHLSARNGRTTVVELLIQRGANVNAPAEEDRLGIGAISPAYFAVYYGHLAEATLLFDAGAKIEGSPDELYPLHGATKNNQYEMIKFLLKRGVNINSIDTSKQTALHMASALGYFDIVKLLINFHYEEHLDEFTGSAIEEQVKKLPDINAEDKRGNTPLHEAAVNGHREIALYLLASGANPKAKNGAGKTPTEEAMRNNRKDMAEDINHEIKKLKALRIQQQKPLLLRIARQEAQLTGQAGLIYRQEEELKKQAAEIDQLKKQMAEIYSLLRK